jgi:hypothetical protein
VRAMDATLSKTVIHGRNVVKNGISSMPYHG